MLLMESRPEADPSAYHAARQPLVGEATGRGNDCICQGLVNPFQTARDAKDARSHTTHSAAGRARVIVEAAEDEASTSGRPFEGSQGALEVLKGLGSDRHAVFTGIFRAPQPGAAKAVLQQFTARLRECAEEATPSDSLLSSAVSRCQAMISSCSELSGCLALVSVSTLTYWSIGNTTIALGEMDGTEVVAVDVNDSDSRKPATLSARERLKSLGHVVQQARSAFGSIIPIDRAAALLGGSPQPPPPAVLELNSSHAFLVLGVAQTSGAFDVEDLVSNAHRFREDGLEVGQAAARLAAASHLKLSAAGKADAHVTVAVVHLQAPASALRTQPNPLLDTPSQEGDVSLLSPQMSPARRVHFLEPVRGSEVAPYGSSPGLNHKSWSPFLDEPSALSAETSLSEKGVPDSSALISSGSMLSQPEMCIPEEGALPEQHTAMQLPPPLLAPIRKAVLAGSGSNELLTTPTFGNKLVNVPAVSNQAKIGRAASMNSPFGLLPPSPPPLPAPPSFGSFMLSMGSGRLGSGGSRASSGGDEGRVRGGIPRAVSVPSALVGLIPSTPSPESPASLTASIFGGNGKVSRPGSQENLRPAPLPRHGSERLLPKTSLKPPSSPEGGKMHGKSAALRMLQATSQPVRGAPASAPATLEQSLGHSSSPRDRLLEGAASSTSSEAGSEQRRGARVIPFVPQVLEQKASTRRRGNLWAIRDSAAAGGLLEQPARETGPLRAMILADSVGSLTLNGSQTDEDEGPSSPYS